MGFALMLFLVLSYNFGGTCSGSACTAWVLLLRMLQGLSQCMPVHILQLQGGPGAGPVLLMSRVGAGCCSLGYQSLLLLL